MKSSLSRTELEEKLFNLTAGCKSKYGETHAQSIYEESLALFDEFHAQEVEQAYKQGRIDEAKTCEKARRHQLTPPAQQEKE